MACDETKGSRTAAKASSCNEFQFLRRVRWPSGENKLGELGKKSLLEICGDWVLFELFVADGPALAERRWGQRRETWS